MDTLLPPDRLLCAATGRLLHAVAVGAGALGLGCALVAATALLLRAGSPTIAALPLLLLPVERVLALRLRFDAGLFDVLANDSGATLAGLDAALHALRLRAPAAAPRALSDRIAGARRLAVWHSVVVLAQALMLVPVLATAGNLS